MSGERRRIEPYIRFHDGKYETRVGDQTRRSSSIEAARRHRTDLLRRRDLGELFDEEATTLGQEIDGFLGWKRAAGNLSDSGYRELVFQAKLWESFRDVRVSKLRRLSLEDHIMARAAEHPSSAQGELVFLKAVLKRSVGRGQRVDERILAIDPIRHRAREGVALTPAELAFLAGVFPEHLRRLPLLAGTIGMRASEWYTLEQKQLELDASPEALLRVWRDTRGNKSRKEKAIPVTPGERVLLREQLVARAGGTRLLFPRIGGTPYTVGGFLKDVWYPKRKEAAEKWREENSLDEDAATPFLWTETVKGEQVEIGVTFHHLRHTAISLMCRAGYRPEWVAERVGHRDGGKLILGKYRHLYPSEMSTVALQLDALRESEGA